MFERASSHHISVRAMTAVAAGLFVGMIAPITGGPIQPYEVREFSAAVSALANGKTSTPALEPAYYPRSRQRMPDITDASGNYYDLAAPRVTEQPAATEIAMAQPVLQAAENARLRPIRAALEGEVTPAMQVLDEPLEDCLDCDLAASPTEEMVIEGEADAREVEELLATDPADMKGNAASW